MEVPILKLGEVLIATVPSALTDHALLQLRDSLVDQVGTLRAKGVIVDVTSLDVLDSFATRTLRDIAQIIKLRGAETVVVGIQPDVAFAMVRLGLKFEGVATALDLEEGFAFLNQRTAGGGRHATSRGV
ncbi:MAG: STAS domain-containing protein [Deltaproteobacteria bacterium]|nr:STAS domain-containing protein [Deltaproteobacteria bacterium]